MENEKFNAMVKELVSGYMLQGLSLNEAVVKLAETVKASLLAGGIYEELHGKALQIPAAVPSPALVARNSTIASIKASLKARGLSYSVRGGRGTTWGWITIDLMPKWFKNGDTQILKIERANLNKAFGLENSGYISVPAGNDYYREYMDRAAGRTPSKLGKPYWD